MTRWLSTLLLFAGSLTSAQDVVHLKTGQSAACTITAITDNIVTYTLPRVPGAPQGSAKRTLQMDQVAYVQFGFQPGEESVFAGRDKLDAEILEKWWDFYFANLHRPRSRTAAYGVALGNALLREEAARSHQRALSLFDRIIERAWAEEDIAAARQGRLRALIAVGDLDTAVREAADLATRTEDPELLIEVKFLLAEADFEKLKKLQEDHPRWEEDDEVRPERNALFHRIVDQYLWPHLFHATREDAASRGLLSAGVVYEFVGEPARARACYVDLSELYPDTESAGTAAKRLASLLQTTESSQETETP